MTSPDALDRSIAKLAAVAPGRQDYKLTLTGDTDKVTPGLVPEKVAEIPGPRGRGTQVHVVKHNGDLGRWLEVEGGRKGTAQAVAAFLEKQINGSLNAAGHKDRVRITAVPVPTKGKRASAREEHEPIIADVVEMFCADPFGFLEDDTKTLVQAANSGLDNLDTDLTWRALSWGNRAVVAPYLGNDGAAPYRDIVQTASRNLGLSKEEIKRRFTPQDYEERWDEEHTQFVEELQRTFKRLTLREMDVRKGLWVGAVIEPHMFTAEGNERVANDFLFNRMPDMAQQPTWDAEEIIARNPNFFTGLCAFEPIFARALQRLDDKVNTQALWWEDPESWMPIVRDAVGG